MSYAGEMDGWATIQWSEQVIFGTWSTSGVQMELQKCHVENADFQEGSGDDERAHQVLGQLT